MGRVKQTGVTPDAVLAVVLRPDLWVVAVRQATRLARSGWWRHWPPLPRADPAYLRFRLVTQYGGSGAPPAAGDLIAYLEWCRGANRRVG